MKRETLRVAFRIERSGDPRSLTAVLPDIPANPGRWACYAHVGQHAECDHGWYYTTRAATPMEYRALLRELRAIYERSDGLRLRVVQRIARRERK
ncbi:MAG: hypothetical protein KGL39_09595 [Patescibacteria group bacterium]|nr:hypothetical protein [Patescibacteria group bacterium]